MSWFLIFVLIFIGLVFLLLEVLVIPGTTIAGIIGFGLIATGIWQAFTSHGTQAGVLSLIITLFITLVTLYFALKSKTWQRLSLKTSIESKVNTIDESEIKSGDTGITVSRLAPSGKARINGNIFEVHTFGEFIDPGIEIVVVNVEVNKVFVTTKS